MKSTGYFSPTEDEFDLQGHIDLLTKPLKEKLKHIDINHTKADAKEIKKALLDTIIHNI